MFAEMGAFRCAVVSCNGAPIEVAGVEGGATVKPDGTISYDTVVRPALPTPIDLGPGLTVGSLLQPAPPESRRSQVPVWWSVVADEGPMQVNWCETGARITSHWAWVPFAVAPRP
jgi:hypothetical protein